MRRNLDVFTVKTAQITIIFVMLYIGCPDCISSIEPKPFVKMMLGDQAARTKVIHDGVKWAPPAPQCQRDDLRNVFDFIWSAELALVDPIRRDASGLRIANVQFLSMQQ